MPTQMSPATLEMSTLALGETMELSTGMTEMTPGEALASSLFFQHHQFMCSECGGLYNTLEDVLSHQEQHAPTAPDAATLATHEASLEPGGLEDGPFQCCECNQLILSPTELLAHQDAHLRESTSQIQYQCGDCQELFPSPELWIAHRQTQHLPAAPLAEPPGPLPPPTPPAPPELKMEPYECPECSALCATPEEFLEHQGTHFDSLEKEERNGLEEEEDEEEEETGDEEAAMEAGDDAPGEDKATASQAPGCGDCLQHRTSSGARRRHRRASRGPTSATHPFHCGQCQRTFSSANRLLAHGRAHIGGTHECPACSKVFKKAASLEQHVRLHRGEARYLCVDCGRGFGTELTLVAHRRAHTANPLHRCRCGKTFSNMTKFLYHRRTHSGKSGAPPNNTAGSLAPPEPTRPPLAPVPAPPVQLPCPQCSKSFASASRLSRHRRAVHGPPERRHRCGICGRGFKKLVHVHNHLRTHTGERPFQCHSCGKTFASLANLSRHQLTHTGVRPYQCLDCGKRFTQSSNLQQHRRLHLRPVAFARAPRLPITGLYKSPYYCGTCGRWFRALAGLRLHQRVHSHTRTLPLPRSPPPAPPPPPEPQQTIMCTELGETIAIIETSQPLALEDTLQLCQAALGASEAGGLLQLDTAFE